MIPDSSQSENLFRRGGTSCPTTAIFRNPWKDKTPATHNNPGVDPPARIPFSGSESEYCINQIRSKLVSCGGPQYMTITSQFLTVFNYIRGKCCFSTIIINSSAITQRRCDLGVVHVIKQRRSHIFQKLPWPQIEAADINYYCCLDYRGEVSVLLMTVNQLELQFVIFLRSGRCMVRNDASQSLRISILIGGIMTI